MARAFFVARSLQFQKMRESTARSVLPWCGSREAVDLEQALQCAERLAQIAPSDQNISKLIEDLQQQVKKKNPDPQ